MSTKLATRPMTPQVRKAADPANPLKRDTDLQTLVQKVSSIREPNRFHQWVTKFSDRLESLLDPAGMTAATEAGENLDEQLKQFMILLSEVQRLVETGALSNTRKTVRASTALNELCSSLTKVTLEMEVFIPFTSHEEKSRGFSKIHLGAVLVRHRCHQYSLMVKIKESLDDVGSSVPEALDKARHDIFRTYNTQFQRFMDTMEILQFKEIMLKCHQFMNDPTDECSTTAGEDESTEGQQSINEGSEVDLLPESFQMTVAMPDGSSCGICVQPTSDRLSHLKQLIFESTGTEVERQVISFEGKELVSNDLTVSEFGLTSGSELQMGTVKVPVTVRAMSGEPIEIMVELFDKVLVLQNAIEAKTGMKTSHQRLLCGKEELFDPEKRLVDYGVMASSELELLPAKIWMKVQMPDETVHSIEVGPSDTTDEVKAKICTQTGMNEVQQVMEVSGDPDDDVSPAP